ncbi:unnamed protein product [Linum trigynum]|uniref:Uncharacterized protein n=1 Tax=Linum trigynum TaxID=586398 RepID=A0AAV2CXP8_9ROSI
MAFSLLPEQRRAPPSSTATGRSSWENRGKGRERFPFGTTTMVIRMMMTTTGKERIRSARSPTDEEQFCRRRRDLLGRIEGKEGSNFAAGDFRLEQRRW